MRKFYILPLILFLMGCSEPQHYYVGTDVSEEKMAKDVFDCRVEISNLNSQVYALHELEGMCMKAKGYKIHSGEMPTDIKNITND